MASASDGMHGQNKFLVDTKLNDRAVFAVDDWRLELTIQHPGNRILPPTRVVQDCLN